MFTRTGECNWSPCKFLHESPAASASSPCPPARGEEGGGSVAAGGGSRALSLRAVLPAGGNSTTGVQALVLVVDKGTGPAARWSQPLRAQLRRRRWGKLLRRQSRVAAAGRDDPRRPRLRRWRLLGRLCRRSRLAERRQSRQWAESRGGGRGRALEALAGEDGVGRERVHVAPG